MPRVVSVWTRWGDYVLGVRDVRPGESLSVGARLLVGFRGSTAHVNGGQALGEGETSRASIDGLEYTLTCFADEAKGFARPRPPLLLFGAATLLLALLVASVLSTPSPVSKLARLPRVRSHALLAHLFQLADPIHDEAPVVVGVEPRAASAVTGGSRCGDAEMGEPALAQTGKSYGVRGPRDSADPRLPRPQPGEAAAHGLDRLAPLGTPLPAAGPSAPTAPWGSDNALGTSERDARGQMWGEQLGANRGEDGLGRQGFPGSVGKRFEVAPTSDAPAQKLRVLHTGLRVSGGRKTSDVGRNMAAHFDDFRRCAETAAPVELHAVELDFEVSPDGHVSTIGQAHSGLEQCLGQSLASVAFPAGASAAAQVRYPLYFVPAQAQPLPPAAAPAAFETCDCG